MSRPQPAPRLAWQPARRTAALVLAGGLLLTACTDEPQPTDSVPPPTSASPTPSSAPSAEAPTATPSDDETPTPSPSATDEATADAPPGDAVAVLTLRGGMCAEDVECETVLAVERDGTWTRSEQGVVAGTGEVHPADLEWWSTAGADVDPDSLVAGKATDCPSDADGREVVLETLTSDGWVTLASCEVELAESEVLERLSLLLEATEF